MKTTVKSFINSDLTFVVLSKKPFSCALDFVNSKIYTHGHYLKLLFIGIIRIDDSWPTKKSRKLGIDK